MMVINDGCFNPVENDLNIEGDQTLLYKIKYYKNNDKNPLGQTLQKARFTRVLWGLSPRFLDEVDGGMLPSAALHFVPGNCEGGWGYNDDHTNLAGFLTDFAKTNDFTEAELVASPIFRRFDNDVLHQTNRITIAQTELNKVLGDGIPALSFAAGRNEISCFGDGGNYNYQGVGIIPNGWPKLDDDDNPVWEHSDIKNVAYFYVRQFFKKIVDETKQGR